MENPTSRPLLPGKPERLATQVSFFIGGFASATWAPLVPYAKQRLGLDEGGLGLVLLCFGLGSLFTMFLAGWAAGKFGCRRVLRLGSILACICLPFLAFVDSVPVFVAFLLLFGAAIGTIDVTVNIQAVIVEQAIGRPLMSGFHAGWSIGGFAGAGLLMALFALGLNPLTATIAASAVVLFLHFLTSGGLLPYGSPSTGKVKMRFPRGIILAIGSLAFISFLAEGSVLDWGAVFLSSNKGTAISMAGMGYMVFSVIMLLCRLAGDSAVRKLGGVRVLFFGALLGAAGFGVVILAPVQWLSFLGFGLIGLGLSNLVPVLYSLVGKQSLMPAHQAISVVSTIAYMGILLGPVIVGGIAKFISLSLGLGIVALMLLAISASARLARR
jgi:predicted MFS family arabinose efflux permease